MKRIYIVFLFMFLYCSLFVYSFEPELKWKMQGEDVKTNAFVFSKDGKYIYVQYNKGNASKDTNFIQKWNIEKKMVEKEIPCSG